MTGGALAASGGRAFGAGGVGGAGGQTFGAGGGGGRTCLIKQGGTMRRRLLAGGCISPVKAVFGGACGASGGFWPPMVVVSIGLKYPVPLS